MSKIYDEVIATHYQHVDNGGLTMEVIKRRYDSDDDDGVGVFLRIKDDGVGVFLRIEDGYYGYSGHILEFHEVVPDELRKFAEMFILAANKLDEK
jgi:hypothetical protein